MFPLINKRETGVNLRRIMDMRGISPKDVQEYLGLGCVQSVYRWTDGVNMPSVSQMAQLFDREESNIKRHILNVFKENEVDENNNVHFIHVNNVKKPVPFYFCLHII